MTTMTLSMRSFCSGRISGDCTARTLCNNIRPAGVRATPLTRSTSSPRAWSKADSQTLKAVQSIDGSRTSFVGQLGQGLRIRVVACRQADDRSASGARYRRSGVEAAQSGKQPGQRRLLRRVDLGHDQPIRNLHLGAPKRFAAQLLEGVQRVRGHNDLADDDVVHEDGIAPDGLDDWPRIGEPARLEDDALESLAARVEPATRIADPTQQADQLALRMAADAAFGEHGERLDVAKNGGVDRRLGGLVDDDEGVLELTMMQLVPQPRRFA